MSLTPVASESRIEAVDALRGLALLGILLVNILFFAFPASYSMQLPRAQMPDGWALLGIAWLAQGKFYGIFSFLLGLGFAIQMERWEGEGPGRFRRRALILLGFGLLHGVLLWMGDILTVYAVLGLILPAFRACRPRTLLVWMACLLGLLAVLMLLIASLTHLGEVAAPQEMAKQYATSRAAADASVKASLQAYGQGPYGLLFRHRAKELFTLYAQTLFVAPHIFSMFLAGLWCWKQRVLQDTQAWRPFVRRWALWGLGLGLPMNLIYALGFGRGFVDAGMVVALYSTALYFIAAPLLSFGYLAGLWLLLTAPRGQALLHALKWPGRMALTNYLTETLVMTTVFYSYGFGLFGKVRLPWVILGALGLWLLLLPWSRFWLRRFQYGPAEWVWRSLTYGTPQPWRREA